MAIRTDIFWIDWEASPRIIWIRIAWQEASVQDLYDTCRYYEARSDGIDEPSLMDAGGWEPLGGGVYNGITVSLFNAQYAFADRPGPDWVICNLSGGNIVAFTGPDRLESIYPRRPTAFVSADRTSASSSTTIKEITEGVWHAPLEGEYTAAQMIRIISAVLGGELTGAGTGVERFKSIADDAIERVVSETDEYGNRIQVDLDVSE